MADKINECSAPNITLSSLPIEVLSTIATLLDRNTLISLRRVSRAFLSLDDKPLWADLHLTLSRCYGASPYTLPLYPVDPERTIEGEVKEYNSEWAEAEMGRCEVRYRTALRNKVTQIIKLADARRWAMVKSVTMAPRPSSIHPMLLVLEYASRNLQTLHIESAPHNPFPLLGQSDRYHTFLFGNSLIDFPLSLPVLTHLRLTSFSSSNGEFCLELCALAPNLISIDIEFDRAYIEPFIQDLPHYTFPGQTKVRQVRCSWRNRAGDDYDEPAAALCGKLLSISPNASHVELDFGDIEDAISDELKTAVTGLQDLQVFRWSSHGWYDDTLPKTLRRLMLNSYRLEHVLRNLHTMPSLERLYLERPNIIHHPLRQSALYIFPDGLPDRTSFGIIATLSLRQPCLRFIHLLLKGSAPKDLMLLDDPAETAIGFAALSSITHGALELVQITFFRDYVQVDDRPRAYVSHPYNSSDFVIERYPSPAGGTGAIETRSREAIYRQQSPPCAPTRWSLAAYEGTSVPLGIVEKMRETAGASVDDWDRRGVEVGAEVWKVLEDWCEGRESESGDQA